MREILARPCFAIRALISLFRSTSTPLHALDAEVSEFVGLLNLRERYVEDVHVFTSIWNAMRQPHSSICFSIAPVRNELFGGSKISRERRLM